ncbi:glycoside hydrolase family 36 N-terminal domain-containing protein, partial [Streptomyces kebangsaanensis]|uniref:glycoside hydrolase family 36 N-terminal domain-containing protein n=1 Tax=Streptomyces kebangsaanensis TaxID=864058 RepID=UPI002D21D04B
MLQTADDGRTWLLTGPTSGYAVHLTEHGELRHLHWGPRIELADAEALAARPLPDHHPFESRLDGHEEYPVEGGPRFVRPALSVRTAERRGTEWTFESCRTGGGELRLRFNDSGLGITLHYRMRGDVVERWVTLDNQGPDTVELLRADSATWTLPHREGWRLSQLHGRWAAESRLVRTGLTYGEKVLGSRRGHTGHQHLPWVALDTDATEEHGEVYGCALGWSGSWRIAVAQLPDARVQITGGAGYDDSGLLRLRAGESYTTPVFAGLW